MGQPLLGTGDGGLEPVHPSRSGIILHGDATGVDAVDADADADGDGDGELDLVATMNGEAVRTLLNEGS